MNEPQPLAPPSPVAGLNAKIGIIGERQEQLAQVVAELGGSVSDFDQLRTYVEQIATILATLAKEVGAHDLAGVERRLDEMGRVTLEFETLRQEMREIAAIVSELVQRRETAPAPWWPDLPAGPEREEAMLNLGTWVDEVLRVRHPEAYNELGTCWFQHPDILDELTALRAAWFAAYRDPGASPMAAIEWHDHWLPRTISRCRKIIRTRGCKARHQKQPDPTVSFLDRPEFRNFAKCASDAATPATQPRPPWGPAVEPEPPWGPAVEPAAPGGPAAESEPPGSPGAEPVPGPAVAPAPPGGPVAESEPPGSPGAEPVPGPAVPPASSWSPAPEPEPPQGPESGLASPGSPAAEPAQSWEPITEPIQSWGPAGEPPPPPPPLSPPPPPPLPLPIVEPETE